jgi:hypothetical protein
MAQIMTAVVAVFTGLFDLLVGILVPTTGLTPLSTVIWFFILSPAIMWAVKFVRSLAS